MEFRQLTHFVAVAEERSFTKAARRANIVQSGISTSIATLERELGVALFARSKHHVELTVAGRALLLEARRALSALAAARASVSTSAGAMTGTLTLGVVPILPMELQLPPLLREFRRANPGVRVVIQTLSRPLLDDLIAGDFDLAFGPCHGHSGVTSLVLGRYPIALVCSESHALAPRQSTTLAAVAKEPFIDTPKGWITRTLVDRAFDAAGLNRRSAFEVNHVPTIMRLIEEGIGVSLLPDVPTEYSPGVRRVDVRPPIGVWEAAVSFVGDEPKNTAARAFYDLLLRTPRRLATLASE